MKWAIVVLTVVTLSVVAVGLFTPSGSGGAWDDEGPDGHSALVQRLSDDRSVRIIKSSLALLPRDAGADDALLLFPTHRPASAVEVERVRSFVEDGGLLVLAADGDNAAPWAEALGVRFKGLPALLPPESELDCVPIQYPLAGTTHDVCLPSPTTFPDLDRLTTGDVSLGHVAYSQTPVFLDADRDGTLSAGDQGPVASPVVLQWDFGPAGGQVVAVADADVWRNSVVRDHPGNLEFARALTTSQGGELFVDSSGAQPTLLDRMNNPGYRLLSGPDLVGHGLLLLLLLGLVVGTRSVPRISALRPHDPPENATDPVVAQAAMDMVHEYLHDAKKRLVRPPRPARRHD